MLPSILNSKNWPLGGLYMLSKDVFEDEFRRTMEPEAENLKTIRDHLEHKYLQVHETLPPTASSSRLGVAIERDNLQAKTVRLLQMVRGALVHFSLAIHHEERRRHANREPGVTLPLQMEEIQNRGKW
ncbi:MAG: LA2681 family HEPN domain-containing protein [Gammaproteobacteria bacterium]